MEQAAGLRAEVAGLARRYAGERYPAELRGRIVGVARARRAAGVSWRRIGLEVGVRGRTLGRWCEGGRVAGFVPVELVGGGGVVVVSPSGWRVEGLSAAEALSLVRSLS